MCQIPQRFSQTQLLRSIFRFKICFPPHSDFFEKKSPKMTVLTYISSVGKKCGTGVAKVLLLGYHMGVFFFRCTIRGTEIFSKSPQHCAFSNPPQHSEKNRQKRVKNRFYSKLISITTNVWVGKEPEFKSFPGLKRVLTLSGGKNSKNRFLCAFFWPF